MFFTIHSIGKRLIFKGVVSIFFLVVIYLLFETNSNFDKKKEHQLFDAPFYQQNNYYLQDYFILKNSCNK